jgi:DNA-binding transcriptional ArsR family regulator
VASTTEMLRAMLEDTAYRALELLADTTTSMSGRTVAAALGVAPTTATVALRKLRQAGFAASTREGRADRWRLNAENPVIRSWLQETREVAQPPSGRRQGQAVILTALPEEYEAVVSHLEDPQPERAGKTRYECGKFSGLHIDWAVHVAEIGMGNVAASTELAAAQASFEPDVVLFVGVAGSVKPDDLCRGDVVVGSEAFNIHAGKDAVDDGGRAVSLGRPVGPQAQYGAGTARNHRAQTRLDRRGAACRAR